MRRSWIGIPLALLLVAGLAPSVWANSEMHPGGRLFYPLWDVSTPNRLTFIIVTREARREGSSIAATPAGTFLSGVPTVINSFKISGTPGNCIPRGAAGSSKNINRTDLGGTSTVPVFVDDVHFEWYGKSCASADETVHMSCADIDLFLLASTDNASGLQPRFAFSGVAGEGRGALDVNLVVNGTSDPKFRKDTPYGNTPFKDSSEAEDRHSIDNSLMGHAVISDLAEGWAATYPAAAARTTTCGYCGLIDGGTRMGYEAYPMEVFLPFALADTFSGVPSGAAHPLRNVLSMWGPAVLPGGNLNNTTINIDFKWWDGRERAFTGSINAHSLIRPLGGASIAGLDPPIDGSRFTVANFTCGLSVSGSLNAGKAENDGFPRSGTVADQCGVPLAAGDADHPSDNFDNSGDVNQIGSTIQSSTPIGWWRFALRRDGTPPAALSSATVLGPPLQEDIEGYSVNHSGRGLVGVVLSSTDKASGNGVGDATRLWHKEGCHKAQSNTTVGPPHVGEVLLHENLDGTGTAITFFNAFSFANEYNRLCEP